MLTMKERMAARNGAAKPSNIEKIALRPGELQGTLHGTPRHLHAENLHKTADCSAVTCELPHGYVRYMAVIVRPENSNARPVCIGLLVNEASGRRMYLNINPVTGRLTGASRGIRREYQRHIKLSYLKEIAQLPKGYEVTLKEIANGTVGEYSSSPRLRAGFGAMAGGDKKPHAARPNRKPMKDEFYAPVDGHYSPATYKDGNKFHHVNH